VKGKTVGLITNPTGVDRRLRTSVELLRESGQVALAALYGPEHGVRGNVQGGVFIPFYFDDKYGIPVFSLYGQALKTDPGMTKDMDASMRSFDGDPNGQGKILEDRMIRGIDALLFDIQDVGVRVYTYVATMAYAMQAAARAGIPFIVLDRPNPLGGSIVEGPMLDQAYRSFVGIFPVPVRHGMTPAELALLYRDWKNLDVRLTVLGMKGWRRSMLFPETGLPWVPPSPNMPTVETAAVYPGMCLFEGLNASEGRGTTTPFRLFGAPFINPYHLLEQCKGPGFKGIYLRPTWFKPTFHKFQGESIGGLWMHVCDQSLFRPFAAAVALTAALHELYPADLQFLGGVYEFNDTIPAFDLLAGTDSVRHALLDGNDTPSIISSWQQDESAFLSTKEQYHLYR